MTRRIADAAARLALLLNNRPAAAGAHAAASRAEPEVAARVGSLPALPGLARGARLVGLDHEMKGLGSIGEKLGRLGDDESLRDTLRYTLVLKGMNFANQVVTAADHLRDAGFACIRLEATEGQKGWARGYIGVNSNWRTGDGAVFEIQFHTELTWYAKTESHGAYEAWRTDKNNGAKREANTRKYRECFGNGAAALGVEAWKLDGVGQALGQWFARNGQAGG